MLQGQVRSFSGAVRQIRVTVQTYYRWREEYCGVSRDHLKRLEELETENTRLRRAVLDLTLDKMILFEAARGNFQALRAAVSALIMCGRPLACLSVEPAARSGSIVRPSARLLAACRMKLG